MSPQVSVVMPVYNSSDYLRESIESVLMQTFNDFEFIIIDDGSTDDSFKRIVEYQDKRIKAYRLSHDFIRSLNYGMSIATGKYIVRMDSDDKMLPDRLKIQFNYMEAHEHVAVCGSWIQTFGIDDKIYKLNTEYQDIICEMLSGNPICHPSVIIRKDILYSIFYDKGKSVYDKSYIYAEDYKLWSDIIMNGGIISNINQVLLMYRCSINQISHKEGKHSFKSALNVRMDYLKYVCKQMALNDSSYVNILKEVFILFDSNKIDFFVLCNIVKMIYKNYLKERGV